MPGFTAEVGFLPHGSRGEETKRSVPKKTGFHCDCPRDV
jgi:hypothetical protein